MPHRLCHLGLFLIWLLSFSSPAIADITLFQDFDSGSLNVASSSVSGDDVFLVGRRTWTDVFNDDFYRWVYFRADDVQGLTPTFHLDEPSFLGDLTDHRFVYSYDQTNWQYFDSGDISGGNYTFANNSPFTQSQVYVAYGLPYPVSRTQQMVSQLATSPYVSPTFSADSNLVIGQSAGGVDDLGRTIPAHDIYGFQVSDPTSIANKQKMVIVAGAHSGESMAHYVVEGFLDFLTSDSLDASHLRSLTEVFVYPQVNPDGRFAGYYRSNPENPSKDFNRFYNNPAGFTDLSILVDALRADTAGDTDYLLDFHSYFGPWTENNNFRTVPSLADAEFIQQVMALQPDFETQINLGLPGMLRRWGMTADGISAENSFTVEIGFHPGTTEIAMRELGETFARALLATLDAPDTCDLNADGLCDVDDVDLLTSLGNLTLGVNGADPKFDLTDDGLVNGEDLAKWLAEAADVNGLSSPYLVGDANVSGQVDGLDFIAWNEGKFQAGTTWSTGDFNGDGATDGADFILWNASKFQASDVAVPEPHTLGLAMFLLVGYRHRSWHA